MRSTRLLLAPAALCVTPRPCCLAGRFIELFSPGGVNLTGLGLYRFEDTDLTAGRSDGVDLASGPITSLPAGGFLIVCDDKLAFDSEVDYAGATCDIEGPTSSGHDNFALVTLYTPGPPGAQFGGDSSTIFDVFGVIGEDGDGSWHEVHLAPRVPATALPPPPHPLHSSRLLPAAPPPPHPPQFREGRAYRNNVTGPSVSFDPTYAGAPSPTDWTVDSGGASPPLGAGSQRAEDMDPGAWPGSHFAMAALQAAEGGWPSAPSLPPAQPPDAPPDAPVGAALPPARHTQVRP